MFTIRQRSLLQIGALVVIVFFLALIFSTGFLAALLWAVILGIAFGFLLRQNIRVADGVDILREDVPLDLDSKREMISETLGSSTSAADGPDEPSSEQMDMAPPPTLEAPRPEGPDDLTRISGIGPKLRDLLHSKGYFHFDQIANWSEEELRWIDNELEGFKGRASRDNWISQARELASH